MKKAIAILLLLGLTANAGTYYGTYFDVSNYTFNNTVFIHGCLDLGGTCISNWSEVNGSGGVSGDYVSKNGDIMNGSLNMGGYNFTMQPKRNGTGFIMAGINTDLTTGYGSSLIISGQDAIGDEGNGFVGGSITLTAGIGSGGAASYDSYTIPSSIYAFCGEEGGNPATNTIDTDPATFWAHTKLEEHDIAFDFGSSINHTKISIYSDPKTIGGVCGVEEIRVSDDPNNWGVIDGNGLVFGIGYDCDLGNPNLCWRDVTLFSQQEGQYVNLSRIYVWQGSTCMLLLGIGSFNEFRSVYTHPAGSSGAGGNITLTAGSPNGYIIFNGILGLNISAENVLINDSEGYYQSNHTEGALQELGRKTQNLEGFPLEPVIDKDLAIPPVSPTTGDRYIVSSIGRNWFNQNWKQRIALTIDERYVTGTDANMTNIQIPFSQDDCNSPLFNVSKGMIHPQGWDIVITNSSHNIIPYRRETFLINSTSFQNCSLRMWFAPPIVNATINTTIYLYFDYNNTNVDYQQTASNFWNIKPTNDAYRWNGVYTMERSGTTLVDSSPVAGHSAAAGGSLVEPKPFIKGFGKQIHFNRTGAYTATGAYYSFANVGEWESAYSKRSFFLVYNATDVAQPLKNISTLLAQGLYTNGMAIYITNGQIYIDYSYAAGTQKFLNCTTTAGDIHTVGVAWEYNSLGRRNLTMYCDGVEIGRHTTTATFPATTGDGGIGYSGVSTKTYNTTLWSWSNIRYHAFNGTLYDVLMADAYFTPQYITFMDALMRNQSTRSATNPSIWVGSPTVLQGAEGDWDGHENNITEYNGTHWTFIKPQNRNIVWVSDESAYYVYSNASQPYGNWNPIGTVGNHNNLDGLQGGLQNITPKQLNHLSNTEYDSIRRYANSTDDGLMSASQYNNLQDAYNNRVRVTGDTMTGDLVMSGLNTKIILSEFNLVGMFGQIISYDGKGYANGVNLFINASNGVYDGSGAPQSFVGGSVYVVSGEGVSFVDSGGGANSGTGGNVTVVAGAGGDAVGGDHPGVGGNVYITGGEGGTSDSGNDAEGGNVYISGGAGTFDSGEIIIGSSIDMTGFNVTTGATGWFIGNGSFITDISSSMPGWVGANDTALWTNASVQEGKFASLWTNASDQETDITNLWTNASDQETDITNLWTNASSQEAKFVKKAGDTMTGLLNITSGWFDVDDGTFKVNAASDYGYFKKMFQLNPQTAAPIACNSGTIGMIYYYQSMADWQICVCRFDGIMVYNWQKVSVEGAECP